MAYKINEPYHGMGKEKIVPYKQNEKVKTPINKGSGSVTLELLLYIAVCVMAGFLVGMAIIER